jgi:hypothetical protein
MIALPSDKTCEQIHDLLRNRIYPIKTRQLLLPFFTVGMWGNVFAGRINKNEFYLIPHRLIYLNPPYRFFYGKIIEADNKAMIVGKFKHHSSNIITYMIMFALALCFGYFHNIMGFILITFSLVIGFALLMGIWRGRKYEKETIETLMKILSE